MKILKEIFVNWDIFDQIQYRIILIFYSLFQLLAVSADEIVALKKLYEEECEKRRSLAEEIEKMSSELEKQISIAKENNEKHEAELKKVVEDSSTQVESEQDKVEEEEKNVKVLNKDFTMAASSKTEEDSQSLVLQLLEQVRGTHLGQPW
jgi:tryptophanyl-tRNA synthetase